MSVIDIVKFYGSEVQYDSDKQNTTSYGCTLTLIFASIVILEYKCINHKLKTTLFKKPTDQPSYLQVNFKHPRTIKDGVVYNEALRIFKLKSS